MFFETHNRHDYPKPYFVRTPSVANESEQNIWNLKTVTIDRALETEAIVAVQLSKARCVNDVWQDNSDVLPERVTDHNLEKGP